MAFTLPTFNLVCNVYTGPWLTKSLRLTDEPCNLAWGRRIASHQVFSNPFSGGNALNGMITLLVGAGVDVRAFPLYPVSDIFEVPSGSGRWYIATFVDDIGKGFSNEHRGVELSQVSPQADAVRWAGSQWPTPMP